MTETDKRLIYLLLQASMPSELATSCVGILAKISRLSAAEQREVIRRQGVFLPRPETTALVAAAQLALTEMCNTPAPRDSFTQAVDALDAALTAMEKT